MDYYSVTKMDPMDTNYVRYGQAPQDHVNASYRGNMPPNVPTYQSRNFYNNKNHSNYNEFDEDSQVVTMQYEGNGSFKNQSHYPNKYHRDFQLSRECDSFNPVNNRSYMGPKVSRHSPSKIKNENFDAVYDEHQPATVNYISAAGFPHPSLRNNPMEIVGQTAVQKSLASFAYGEKTLDVGGNMGLGVGRKTKNFQRFPKSILKNPLPSSSQNLHSYPTSSTNNMKNSMAGFQQHKSVSSRFSPVGIQAATVGSENGQKYPWKYTADGAIRKKKRATPAERNLRFKKIVRPKNAIMCLNELVQSVSFVVEQEGNSHGVPFIIYVEVNGQKYRGYGSSKQLAKQAAAEAALVSFVKPMAASSQENDDDSTPWTTLASFAMFKLFNEWCEGRIGPSPSVTAPNPSITQDSTLMQTLQSILNNHGIATPGKGQMAPAPPQAANIMNSNAIKTETKQIPNPAKQVPANANSIHPVMLLHQMRPTIFYSQSTVVKNDQQVFCVQAQIDNISFVGEGSNVKKAKYDLALKANQALFGVVSTFEGPK